MRSILTSCERAAAAWVKRCSYFTQGTAAPLVKNVVISCERAAAFLVKRCSHFTQGAAAPLAKNISIDSRQRPPL